MNYSMIYLFNIQFAAVLGLRINFLYVQLLYITLPPFKTFYITLITVFC